MGWGEGVDTEGSGECDFTGDEGRAVVTVGLSLAVGSSLCSFTEGSEECEVSEARADVRKRDLRSGAGVKDTFVEPEKVEQLSELADRILEAGGLWATKVGGSGGMGGGASLIAMDFPGGS